MRHFRLSIAQIMLLVLLIGLAIGALRSPSPLMARTTWTATAALLCWSVVAAILGREHRRAFWAGFAVFGWVHLVVIFELYRSGSTELPKLPSLLTTDMVGYLRDHVIPLPPAVVTYADSNISISFTPVVRSTPAGFPYLEFEQIARLLTTLLVAWVGGMVGRLAFHWPIPLAPPATEEAKRSDQHSPAARTPEERSSDGPPRRPEPV